MNTTVVNIRDLPGFGAPGFSLPDGHVYIGRANAAHRLEQSPWANPHRMKTEADRDAVIERFRWELEEALFAEAETPGTAERQQQLREEVMALFNKTLVCWCAPKACHGHVLAEMVGRLMRDAARSGR